jgi:hypothetical protein
MSNEQIRHALELGLESASDLMSEAPRSMVMQISARIDAIRSAINSLAAPSVASGAQELPPLPNAMYRTDMHIDGKGRGAFSPSQMIDYARAAIAAQAKPQQMTDERIIEIATATRSAEANKDGGYILPISFARAILANSAPNKALAQALSDLIDVASQCDSWQSFPSAALEKANAALNAAGVEGV